MTPRRYPRAVVSLVAIIVLPLGITTTTFGQTTAPSQPAADVSLPSDVKAVLEANAHSLTPVVVGWNKKCASLVAEGSPDLPTDISHSSFTRRQSDRDFRQIVDGEKIYLATSEGGQLISDHSFDGNVIYFGSRNTPNPDHDRFQRRLGMLLVERAVQEHPFEGHFVSDYFNRSGIWVANTSAELLTRRGPSPLLLRISDRVHITGVNISGETGKRVAKVRLTIPNADWEAANAIDIQAAEAEERKTGRPEAVVQKDMLILKMRRAASLTHRQTFILDEQIGFAVTKWSESDDNGRLLTETTNSDFRQLDGSLWLPWSSMTSYYTWPEESYGTIADHPVFQETIAVKEVARPKKEELNFKVVYDRPGDEITDWTAPTGMTQYEVSASPSQLDEVVDTAKHKGFITRVGTSLEFWLAALIVVLVVGVAVLKSIRDRQQKGSPTP